MRRNNIWIFFLVLIVCLTGCKKHGSAQFSAATTEKYLYFTVHEELPLDQVTLTLVDEEKDLHYEAEYLEDQGAFALLIAENGDFKVYLSLGDQEVFCQVVVVDDSSSVYYVPLIPVHEIEGAHNPASG